MLKLNRVLETVLYVAHLAQAADFYERVLGLECIHEDRRMRAYDVGGNGVLLLFLQGGSLEPVEAPGGAIPPHDGAGPAHIAFSINPDEIRTAGADIYARQGSLSRPKQHGRVAEFPSTSRDPDVHLLEIATPGLWKGY